MSSLLALTEAQKTTLEPYISSLPLPLRLCDVTDALPTAARKVCYVGKDRVVNDEAMKAQRDAPKVTVAFSRQMGCLPLCFGA
jgi:hypothetical protein